MITRGLLAARDEARRRQAVWRHLFVVDPNVRNQSVAAALLKGALKWRAKTESIFRGYRSMR